MAPARQSRVRTRSSWITSRPPNHRPMHRPPGAPWASPSVHPHTALQSIRDPGRPCSPSDSCCAARAGCPGWEWSSVLECQAGSISSARQSAHQSARESARQSAHQSARNQPDNQPVTQPDKQPVTQPAKQPAKQPENQPESARKPLLEHRPKKSESFPRSEFRSGISPETRYTQNGPKISPTLAATSARYSARNQPVNSARKSARQSARQAARQAARHAARIANYSNDLARGHCSILCRS